MTHDATQETYEEYLRRIHLDDKLKMEWKKRDDQEKEKSTNPAANDVEGCW